jgi:lipoyl(octanoyl) transferase
MLDLKLFKKDIKYFVHQLETWLIQTFKVIGLHTVTKKDRIGIWVPNSINKIESKIAAIGLRIKKWIVYHGVAINISPDLNHFQNIIPCGIKEFSITSLKNEGIETSMSNMDHLLINEFCKLFNTQIINDS